MGLMKFLRSRKGQGLVEYALLVAGVALICTLVVSVLGKKTADMIGTYASLVPGASNEINNDIIVTALFEMNNEAGELGLDMTEILDEAGTTRLNSAIQPVLGDSAGLVVEYRVD